MKISMSAIKEGAKIVGKFASKHSPTIYVAVGVGLMVGAVVKTIVEAPKAKEELDDLEETVNFESDIEVNSYVKEKVMIVVRHYWPTTVMTIGGAAMIFWGHKVSLGRTAAALAAYQMSKDDLKRLENKIVEMDGEKHLEKAKDEINHERVMSTDFGDENVIRTGKGDILFMDAITGQKFRSSFDAIDRAVNALNAEIHSDPELTASLNTWLDLIGCDDSKVGDKLGWRFDKMGQNVEIKYRCVNKPNEEVVHVIEYTCGPIWDYDIYESSDRHSGYGDW